MGTTELLKEKGLDGELAEKISAFKTAETTDAVVKELTDAIDQHGLKGPAVMKLIGSFQTSKKLQPGLYKELVNLNDKLVSGGNTSNGAPAAVGEAAAESSEGFTDKQEALIRAQLQKEEEKMRSRLLKKEALIRARLSDRAEKKASRLGVKVSEAKEITAQREIIAAQKVILAAARNNIKVAREEIARLSPGKPKLSKEEREAAKAERLAARAKRQAAKSASVSA